MANGSTTSSPYRTTALAVLPTHREVVRCGWCAWDYGHGRWCNGEPHGSGDKPDLNRDGDCVYYRDSFTTRLLRRFGLRSPALVRVTDREHKPDNASPRNDGSGHRGGNVGNRDVWAERQREQSRRLREGW